MAIDQFDDMETTQRAHREVNQANRAGQGSGSASRAQPPVKKGPAIQAPPEPKKKGPAEQAPTGAAP